MTGPLKALKGSDASNKFDEEVDEVELEFSDDEKEMEHKKMLKMAKNKNKGKKGRKVPGMAADTTAALQAMNGQPTPAAFTPRQLIALPARPKFDEPEDGYRILQRPGVAVRGSNVPSSSAATGTSPWYQQQQRELQTMMGTSQPHHQQQQQTQQQQPSSQYLQDIQQEQHRQHQQLLQQRQQHQQIQAQQAQQQALYQQQIQKAQETILLLQQQQQQLHQQQQQFQSSQQMAATAAVASHPPSQAFSFTSEQQLPSAPAMHPAYDPMQAQYQPQAGFHPQARPTPPPPQNNPQQFMNLLSPLFPQQQNQNGQHQQPQ